MNKTNKNESIILIPSNVDVKIENRCCSFLGPKGQIDHVLNKNLEVSFEEKKLKIFSDKINCKKKNLKAIHMIINTTLALFKNYIYGVQNLYEKILIIKGIGYKAEVKNNTLALYIGFSNTINMIIPKSIKIEINSNTNIIIRGVSKEKVGQFAANIRFKRKPEPYKGNGIKYKNETIKMKSPKKSK